MWTNLRIESKKLTATRPASRKKVTAGPEGVQAHKDYSSWLSRPPWNNLSFRRNFVIPIHVSFGDFIFIFNFVRKQWVHSSISFGEQWLRFVFRFLVFCWPSFCKVLSCWRYDILLIGWLLSAMVFIPIFLSFADVLFPFMFLFLICTAAMQWIRVVISMV